MRMQCMKLYYTVIDTFALEMQRGNKKHYKFSDTRNEVTIQTLNSIFSPALYAFVLLTSYMYTSLTIYFIDKRP